MGNTCNRVDIWCWKYGENRYCERCANKSWCASKYTGLLNLCLGKWYLLPYLVVPLISARVPLISTRVSAHCQAILLHPEEHTSEKTESKLKIFHLKCTWKCCLKKILAMLFRGPFYFKPTVQIWWKFRSVVTQLLVIILQQFLHMPQQLCCHGMCKMLYQSP